MSAPGYILVVLSLSTIPEQPRVLMRALSTLEFCEAAAKKVETLSTVWGCLPRMDRRGRDAKLVRDASQAERKPPSKRTIAAKRHRLTCAMAS